MRKHSTGNYAITALKKEKKKDLFGPYLVIRKNLNVINADLHQNIKINLMYII
jgi:hypothetical protein